MTKRTHSIRNCPDLMTAQDIQNILHIGRSTAYKLLKNGQLRSIRIGTIYRIPKAFLSEYIDRQACNGVEGIVSSTQDESNPQAGKELQ